MTSGSRSRWQRKDRPMPIGGAVVEFAVCLPILMMLVLGAIEATSAIFLKETLSAAAYEAIREAARNKSTTASAQSLASAVLSARQVNNSSVVFTPSDVSAVGRGARVIVEVSAPIRGNSPFIGNVISDRSLKVRSVMIKE